MKTSIAISFCTALTLLCNIALYSSETNTSAASADSSIPDFLLAPTHEAAVKSLKLLVARIHANVQMHKENEADYADIINDFDALLAKYKNKSDDRFNILFEKGQLYLAELGDPIKALQIFEQLKTEYPDTVINGNTDIFLAGLRDDANRKKIRDTFLPGTSFPDFNEKDIQGNPLSISKYKGKVVLVDFWATWCGPCVAELPLVQSAYKKYHDKGFEIVGISLDEDKDALESFVKKKKMPWPQYFEGKRFDGKLPVKYGVDATPTTYLIDREGKIIKRVENPETLDAEIANALKKS
jgi:thiol-disulfide isomerase/thioredoxin